MIIIELMNKSKKYTLTLTLLLIVSICVLLILQYKHAYIEKFNASANTVVVTAYYPLHKNKHGHQKYIGWIKNFFNGVKCEIVCFCSEAMKPELETLANESNANILFSVNEFDSFTMMSPSQMDIWREFNKIDPEQSIHSPELYAIWAAKQEFVNKAMQLKPADIYVWCDIGCFRTPHTCDFKHTYKYVQPGKIVGLDIENMIGGTVLAGDKTAWEIFSTLYLNELKANPHGKDQIIYKRILNPSNSVIITPPSTINHDPWFHFTYIFDSNYV